jgi:hypothetical protein
MEKPERASLADVSPSVQVIEEEQHSLTYCSENLIKSEISAYTDFIESKKVCALLPSNNHNSNLMLYILQTTGATRKCVPFYQSLCWFAWCQPSTFS